MTATWTEQIVQALHLATDRPDRVTAYFDHRVAIDQEGGGFTGQAFDRIAADSPPDRFTAADLYACALLSVPIPPRVGAAMLGQDGPALSALLRRIPTDCSIADVEAGTVLGEDGAAWALYERLRPYDGVGSTMRSKLLAVKRPALVPIRDSLVERALGAKGAKEWWAPMVEAWRDGSISGAVAELRRQPDAHVPAHVTDLRLVDTALWLHAYDGGTCPLSTNDR